MKILLIEDDEACITVLTKNLTAQHYVVDAVRDGESGWLYGSTFEYDLIILDILLPKVDGITLCQRFRTEGYTIPILLLTSQDSSTAKVQGLNAGADDYVVKPFDRAELIARVRALLRRGSANPLPILAWGDLLLNPGTCEVTYNDQPLTLTTKEYDLLELLLRHSHQVLCSDDILDRLWSSEEFPAEATVRSHIRRLRHKLAAVGAPPDFISTMHGRGYYLKAPDNLQTESATTAVTGVSSLDMPYDHDQASQAQTFDQYEEFLNQIWVTTKPKCLDQLGELLQTAQALKCETFSQSERKQAQQLVHQLIGTLGIFNLTEAVQTARDLEILLSDDFNSKQALQLENLLLSLQAAILNIDSITLFQNSQESSLLRLPNDVLANTLDVPKDAANAANMIKVMVMDDDQMWLRTLPKLLKPWEFKVTTLADAQQFWTVLRMVHPDVLVLDVNMPQINGIELCQSLRNDPQWQRLPVLFLSALTDSATQNQAFTVGADDYLCKPVKPVDLANRILNRLRRIRAWVS
jgi:DNA-binding response OmpR family regulator/HPt (histidine-containing phosphotransfer) domain-containing protein